MDKEWILPTHIVATAGVVRNVEGQILMIKEVGGAGNCPAASSKRAKV